MTDGVACKQGTEATMYCTLILSNYTLYLSTTVAYLMEGMILNGYSNAILAAVCLRRISDRQLGPNHILINY